MVQVSLRTLAYKHYAPKPMRTRFDAIDIGVAMPSAVPGNCDISKTLYIMITGDIGEAPTIGNDTACYDTLIVSYGITY